MLTRCLLLCISSGKLWRGARCCCGAPRRRQAQQWLWRRPPPRSCAQPPQPLTLLPGSSASEPAPRTSWLVVQWLPPPAQVVVAPLVEVLEAALVQVPVLVQVLVQVALVQVPLVLRGQGWPLLQALAVAWWVMAWLAPCGLPLWLPRKLRWWLRRASMSCDWVDVCVWIVRDVCVMLLPH